MSILAPCMSRSQVQIQLNYGCYIYISFEVVQGYHVISHLAGILYYISMYVSLYSAGC